jgi:hypothetical protein
LLIYVSTVISCTAINPRAFIGPIARGKYHG